MRKAVPFFGLVCLCVVVGCSSTGLRGKHPGQVDRNPDAVTREFPTSATRMAKIMADVMGADPVLDDVNMVPSQGREFRNFTRAQREELGISMLTPANDVNYDLTARSKDGHPVAVSVRLKGDTSCEVSVLYGSQGDEGFSKDLLDKAQEMMAGTIRDPAVTKMSGIPKRTR